MTDHTKSELLRQLATLRMREAAAVQLTEGRTTTHTKRTDLAAKLPETERAQLSVVHKWEARHRVKPSPFTKTKLAKAKLRLHATQRQIAKLALVPFIEELAVLRLDIVQVERALRRIERDKSKKQKELSIVLTELYDIDSITHVITKRSNGMPIKSATIMVNGERIGLETARQLLMAGDLA